MDGPEYHKPKIYILSHVFIGFAAAYFPWLFPIFHIYQFGQLALNVRVFMGDWTIRPNNSWRHTLRKLLEFFVGFSAGVAIRRLHTIN